jgi:hypothetical protein
MGGDRLDHVGAQRHVLSGKSAAGEGLLRMQGLKAAVELALVAELAEILPDIFDRDVEGSLEEVIGNLRAAVGEALAFPLGRVEEYLFLRHLDL